jgi:Leucine-rich repeat (LRR) protein
MRPSLSHRSSQFAVNESTGFQRRCVIFRFGNRAAPSRGLTSIGAIVSRISPAIVSIVVLCVANVCSVASADTTPAGVSGSSLASSKHAHHQGSNDDECPVRFDDASNQTEGRHHGSCVCNSALREIHCHGLEYVPTFVGPSHQDSHRRVPQVTWNAVYMSRQSITVLRPKAFGRLRTARLVLNFNPIEDNIEPQALAGLGTVLDELQLGACQIQRLPNGLLTGMDKLERLHLWGNRIQQFPVGFFRQARNLRELLLWDNMITVLNGDTLAGLWQLRRLDLDKNNIDELRKEAFRHLPELESLHLANNAIQVR